MLNRATLVGNVGADPEIKLMANGGRIATFSLATSDTWKDRDGNRKEKTEWHRIVVFSDPVVGIIEKYVKRGSKLLIEGSIQTRKYTDASGVEKYTTEIVIQNFGGSLKLLDSKGGDQSTHDHYVGGEKTDLSSAKNIDDDDIPF